jgi:hypothetical protein
MSSTLLWFTLPISIDLLTLRIEQQIDEISSNESDLNSLGSFVRLIPASAIC